MEAKRGAFCVVMLAAEGGQGGIRRRPIVASSSARQEHLGEFVDTDEQVLPSALIEAALTEKVS